MSIENVRIVLLSPLYGGNVGSVCRAMANTGLCDLVIAAPRTIDLKEARMMACHAGGILEQRREMPDLAAAVADCGMVLGTTARGGLYRRHAKTPREWTSRVLEVAAERRVAIVFGPEDNGLANDDLALFTHLIQIPTVPEYSSLNVAQAVLLCCYELLVASGAYDPPREKSDEAPAALRERMFSLWRNMLLKVGFMEEDKADHMMLGLRRVLGRGAVTVDDVNIMMGIARQSEWAAGEGRSSVKGQ